MDQRERGLFIEERERSAFCQSVAHHVASHLYLGPFSALPLCFPSLINSGFVHHLCCMFASAAKERSVQAPDAHVNMQTLT